MSSLNYPPTLLAFKVKLLEKKTFIFLEFLPLFIYSFEFSLDHMFTEWN